MRSQHGPQKQMGAANGARDAPECRRALVLHLQGSNRLLHGWLHLL